MRPDPTSEMLEANIRRARRAEYRQAMILAEHHEKLAAKLPTIGVRIRAHDAHVRAAELAREHGDSALAEKHEALAEGHRKESWDKLMPGQEYHDGAALEAAKKSR